MALNSEMHESYLNMTFEAQMMPELESLPMWGRIMHEMMYELNPSMMKSLSDKNELMPYLLKQSESLADKARNLAKDWMRMNPLPKTATYFDRLAWMNHSKQAAQEILMQEVSLSLKS